METQFARIEVSEAAYSFWDWRNWCGVDYDDFYETFVLKGNRDCVEQAEASWYKRSLKLIHDIYTEVYCGYEEYDPEFDDCDKSLWYKLRKEAENEEFDDSLEGVQYVAGLLYPEWKFEIGTIRGHTQSEWQEVLYRADKVKDLEMLEAAYFGKMYRVWCGDIDESTYITHDEYWRAEIVGNVERLLRQRLNLGNKYEVEIFKCRYEHGWETWEQLI